MERIRVLLVDDHAVFRRGIAEVIAEEERLEMVGEASNGREAIERAQQLAPDVVLMDLSMPQVSGLEATQAIKTLMPQTHILVLTASEKESDLFSAIKSGAEGYILKNAEPEEMVQAILQVARGGVIVSPTMASALLAEFTSTVEVAAAQEASALSPREGEVLQFIAQGAPNKEIADKLFISENTVKTHLRNILEKLHLANRSQAAAYAVRAGLVPPKQP
ncbi:MAG: response regulator [Dehalococcoidia bacterium]